MVHLLRRYVTTSFIAVLLTAMVLMWFDRWMSIRRITQMAARSNEDVAQMVMDPIKPALLEFLDAAAEVLPGSDAPPLPPELARSIMNVMKQDHFIVKIKIYNPHGVVVFSTNSAEHGLDHSGKKGFIAAMRGGVENDLVYRDAFNAFQEITEDDNLMRTYLPVRAGPADPIRGVFVLNGDVNSALQADRLELTLFAGVFLIMMGLYIVQVIIVRRANKTIELQQRSAHERSETLARLANRLLQTEESRKQKIALDLHEGIAQTLAAVKLRVESDRNDHTADDGAVVIADSLVSILQHTIEEVRAIATELRPGGLDDLGLLPTLQGLCRKLELDHLAMRIELRISLQESDIPTPLKGILYSIIVSVLEDVARHTSPAKVRVELGLERNELVLRIDDMPLSEVDKVTATPIETWRQSRTGFARMEELATLSGGTFTATTGLDRRATLLRAAWRRTSA